MASHGGRESSKQNGRLIFYHRTTAKEARSVVEEGFKSSGGYFLSNRMWAGVWLSARPLDTDDGAKGDTVLMVKLDIPEHKLARWEWTGEGRPYREWLIPAELLNDCMTVEMVEQPEFSTVAA
jgi:hypothetical protein